MEIVRRVKQYRTVEEDILESVNGWVKVICFEEAIDRSRSDCMKSVRDLRVARLHVRFRIFHGQWCNEKSPLCCYADTFVQP